MIWEVKTKKKLFTCKIFPQCFIWWARYNILDHPKMALGSKKLDALVLKHQRHVEYDDETGILCKKNRKKKMFF